MPIGPPRPVDPKLTIVGWFIIGTLYGLKDRRSDLRASMAATLERLANIAEETKDRAPH